MDNFFKTIKSKKEDKRIIEKVEKGKSQTKTTETVKINQ